VGANAQSGATSRLTVDDWTDRGLALLMAEGVGAIKINRLCRELGVTKGSFYWHFADLNALMSAIADRWCAQTRELLRGLEELHHLPALERIRMMALHLVDEGSWSVERALRDWARREPSVAEVIGQTDEFIFELVRAALHELGYDPRAARLRAGLLIYAGIGFAHGQAALPKPNAEDIDDLMDFITGDLSR
jgi:AcrR family transcriptional regulator